jgi:hypothetical protein
VRHAHPPDARPKRARRSCDLAEHELDDRITRYLAGEPLRLIAADHGVTIASICNTVRRHAPGCYGQRTRGGGPREWPAS